MKDAKYFYTCDVCGIVSERSGSDRLPKDWATGELKFLNIPRHHNPISFHICSSCIIPDTYKADEKNKGTFSKIYNVIKKKLVGAV